MNRADSRQLRTAGAICLGGMALVLLTHLARPHLGGGPGWILLIFGSLPSFGAGLAVPFCLFVSGLLILKLNLFTHKPLPAFLLSLAVSAGGLTAWEFIQFFAWGYPYDLYDFGATGLGSLCALGAFLLLIRNGLQKSV